MKPASRYPTLLSIYEELHAFVAEDRPAPPARRGAVEIDEGRNVTRVVWPGLGAFWLAKPQARVLHELLDALYTSRSPAVDQGHLIRASGLKVRRLDEVFAGCPAWGRLIVPGERAGTYRLAALPPPPPSGDGDDAA